VDFGQFEDSELIFVSPCKARALLAATRRK